MAADPRSPLDHALDLVVFAPVGLALTAKDELPGLIEKGRQRLGSQVVLARMVGQLAAAQGQRVARRRPWSSQMTTAAGPDRWLCRQRWPRPGPARRRRLPMGSVRGTATEAPGAGRHVGHCRWSTADGAEPGPPRRSTMPAPGVDTLAIPGYDSLAASQVVQRLAGLSGPELEAVRRYELAMRGRRTILSKVAQLEAERSASGSAPRP